MNSKFKTFVFLDLETTGLIHFGAMPKITELTLIAIPTDTMTNKDDDSNLRVKHKLTLCFNPQKLINYEASQITGFTNEMLEHEKKFDISTIHLINSFLDHLQKPIVIIAHNGSRFDFKVLKWYYDKFKVPIDSELMCCDSIEVFRIISNMEKCDIQQPIVSEVPASPPPTVESAPIQVDLNDSLDEEFFAEVERIEMEERNRIFNSKNESLITMIQQRNEKTPEQPTKNSISEPNKRPRMSDRILASSAVKRELFPSSSNLTQTQKSSQRLSMKLRDVHYRFFASYPEEAHESEADVITLINCVNACKEDFIQIVDGMCNKFCDI